MNRELILKSPRFVPFFANVAQLGTKPDNLVSLGWVITHRDLRFGPKLSQIDAEIISYIKRRELN